MRACELGSGLLISPVSSGTGLNKKRAVWCNEYVLKHASEVWAGAITPGGTIASLVKALGPWGAGLEARPAAAGTEARHPEVGGGGPPPRSGGGAATLRRARRPATPKCGVRPATPKRGGEA